MQSWRAPLFLLSPPLVSGAEAEKSEWTQQEWADWNASRQMKFESWREPASPPAESKPEARTSETEPAPEPTPGELEPVEEDTGAPMDVTAEALPLCLQGGSQLSGMCRASAVMCCCSDASPADYNVQACVATNACNSQAQQLIE